MNESFRKNIKNIGVGIAATVASVGIPKDVVAQNGLLGKIKDKIQDKIELVSHKYQEHQYLENPEIKKDSIFYNDANDHEGYKYPFNKEYKSDEDFYRAVVYVQDYLLEGAMEDITEKAIDKVKTEMGISVSVLDIKILEQEEFKNKNTGLVTVVLAFEVKKPHISWEGDKIGFKYPFEKKYKSDENFYREVGYRTGYSLEAAKESVVNGLIFKIMKEKTNQEIGEFSYDIKSLPMILEPSKYKYDEKTRIYTVAVAVEIPKNSIVITNKILKKDEDLNNKSEKSTVAEDQKTKNEKFGEGLSGEWKEYKVEKPEEPPIGEKPTKQPVYNPDQKVEKKDYQATFEDFKKAKEAEFDAYKKAQKEKFNKFKEGE